MLVQPVDLQQWTAKDADHWLGQIVRQLPALPPLLRYYDDFDDATRVIHSPTEATVFALHINGGMQYLDFSAHEHSYALLLKHLFLYLLGGNLHVSTATGYLQATKHFSYAEVLALLMAGPGNCVASWAELRALGKPTEAYGFAKALLPCSATIVCVAGHLSTGSSSVLHYPGRLATNMPVCARARCSCPSRKRR